MSFHQFSGTFIAFLFVMINVLLFCVAYVSLHALFIECYTRALRLFISLHLPPLHTSVIIMMSSAIALFSDLLVVYKLIGTALFVVLDHLQVYMIL